VIRRGVGVGFLLVRPDAVVALDTQPVQLTTALHLRRADHGDVVLGLTGDHTGGATDTPGEVYNHRPAGRTFDVLTVAGLRRRIPRRIRLHRDRREAAATA